MAALFGLPALVGVVAVLGLLSATASKLPGRGIAPATAGLCLLATVFGAVILAAGGQSQLLAGGLAVDALSAFFIVLVAFAGLAAACARLGRIVPGMLPGFVGSALFLLLAGDARFGVLGVAIFALAGAGWRPRYAALAGVFLLAGAFAVLSIGASPGFAAMRANPPEGWRAGIVLVSALLGIAPLVGWAPWHRPLLALEATGVPSAAITPVIGLYLATRLLADICGPAMPGWWGLPMLSVGAASACVGIAAAVASPRFAGILAGFAMQSGGWMLAGLGVAIVARSADLLPLATLALGGAMLHALNHTLVMSLATLATESAALAAGSQTLDRLGGLAARMPMVAVGMLVAGLSLALLPPSAGFASIWMVLQALFAVPRVGGLPLQLVVAAAIGVLGLSAGFGVVAAIRLGGMAFLGRPRSPRAAAAEDARFSERTTILALAGFCGVIGFLPGLALQITSPAQRLITAAGLDGQGGWTGLRTQLDSPGYAPLDLTLLILAGLGLVAILARSGRLSGPQSAPAWEGGFTPPPSWMPFGDPATQVTAAMMAASLPAQRFVGPTLPRLRLHLHIDWPPIPVRSASVAILALAVVVLLVVAVFAPA